MSQETLCNLTSILIHYAFEGYKQDKKIMHKIAF